LRAEFFREFFAPVRAEWQFETNMNDPAQAKPDQTKVMDMPINVVGPGSSPPAFDWLTLMGAEVPQKPVVLQPSVEQPQPEPVRQVQMRPALVPADLARSKPKTKPMPEPKPAEQTQVTSRPVAAKRAANPRSPEIPSGADDLKEALKRPYVEISLLDLVRKKQIPTQEEVGNRLAKALGFTDEEMTLYAAEKGIYNSPGKAFMSFPAGEATGKFYLSRASAQWNGDIRIGEMHQGAIQETKDWLKEHRAQTGIHVEVKRADQTTGEAIFAYGYNPLANGADTASSAIGDIMQGAALPLHLWSNRTFADRWADGLRKWGHSLPMMNLYTDDQLHSAGAILTNIYAQAGGSTLPFLAGGPGMRALGFSAEGATLISEAVGTSANAGSVYNNAIQSQSKEQAQRELLSGQLTATQFNQRVEQIKDGSGISAEQRRNMDLHALGASAMAAPLGFAQGRIFAGLSEPIPGLSLSRRLGNASVIASLTSASMHLGNEFALGASGSENPKEALLNMQEGLPGALANGALAGSFMSFGAGSKHSSAGEELPGNNNGTSTETVNSATGQPIQPTVVEAPPTPSEVAASIIMATEDPQHVAAKKTSGTAVAQTAAGDGPAPTVGAEHTPTAGAEHTPTAGAEHTPTAGAEHMPTTAAEHMPTTAAEQNTPASTPRNFADPEFNLSHWNEFSEAEKMQVLETMNSSDPKTRDSFLFGFDQVPDHIKYLSHLSSPAIERLVELGSDTERTKALLSLYGDKIPAAVATIMQQRPFSQFSKADVEVLDQHLGQLPERVQKEAVEALTRKADADADAELAAAQKANQHSSLTEHDDGPYADDRPRNGDEKVDMGVPTNSRFYKDEEGTLYELTPDKRKIYHYPDKTMELYPKETPERYVKGLPPGLQWDAQYVLENGNKLWHAENGYRVEIDEQGNVVRNDPGSNAPANSETITAFNDRKETVHNNGEKEIQFRAKDGSFTGTKITMQGSTVDIIAPEQQDYFDGKELTVADSHKPYAERIWYEDGTQMRKLADGTREYVNSEGKIVSERPDNASFPTKPKIEVEPEQITIHRANGRTDVFVLDSQHQIRESVEYYPDGRVVVDDGINRSEQIGDQVTTTQYPLTQKLIEWTRQVP
jgi:hypothetical protein